MEVIEAQTPNIKPNFKFSRLNFFFLGGGTPSQSECALNSLGQSLNALRNLRAQHPLSILCPEKCPLGWVITPLYNFIVCGPKFTGFLLSNLGGAVVDHLLFGFLKCPPRSGDIIDQSRKLSEIAPKFGRFLALPNFRGGLSKNCTHVITPASLHVGWKSLMEIFSLARNL